MANGHDDFSDILESQAGIFGSSEQGLEPALKQFETTRSVATREGVVTEIPCRDCGGPAIITIEYPELMAIMQNVPPAEAYQGTSLAQSEWRFSKTHGQWYPVVPCLRCRKPIQPLVSHEEAAALLGKAKRNGWLPPQLEQQCHQRVMAAGMRRQAAGR